MARKTGKGADIIAQGIRFTEEFSTMQLIIGVSVLLLFGLGCFLAGILVGKLDGSLDKETVAAESVPDKSETQSKKSEPQTESKPKPQAESKPAPKPAPKPPTPKPNAASSSGPRVTDLPPLPPNTTPAAPKPATPPPAAAAEAAPVLKPAEPMLEAISPPMSMPVETGEAEAGTPVAAPSAEPKEIPKERGSYGIQVASFNGETRNDDAAKFQRELKEISGLDSEIVGGTDGYTRVLIVGYATKDDANKALSGIQQMPKLKDSFVRAL